MEGKEDKSNLQFIDIQWLSAYGLTRFNALEYFYTSPFFDSNSNNQTIRIQGVEPSQHESILMSMIGKEYVLDTINTAEPNLYVIKEQRRISPSSSDVTLLNVYYILDGVIYQCPNFLDLLNSRVNKISRYLTNSFEDLRNSVKWAYENTTYSTNDSSIRKVQGLHVWASTIENTVNDDLELEHNQDEKHDGGIQIQHTQHTENEKPKNKYQKVIREFPSFKSVLLDAHEAMFIET
jgi:hypothetical protein